MIDVSRCKYYNKDEYPFDCDVFDCNCIEKYCYYKQLQQALEENEKLKRINRMHDHDNDILLKLKTKAEQKLEKIKDRIQDIKFYDEHNIKVMNDILSIIEEQE